MKDGLIVDNLSYENLNNISFSLEKGTFTALIGKSGSGKSLLLRCIAGLHEYSGRITVNGNVITKSPNTNEDIGVFTGLFTLTDDTAFENIMDSLINLEYDEAKAKKKVYDISKKLGIENLIYKHIAVLSHSQKKMVALAKSLIHEPTIILLDNAFDSLDSYYRNRLVHYLKSIKNSIIVFTTNDSEDLMYADEIIIIKDGKIALKGIRDSVFEKQNEFKKNEIKLPLIIDLSYKLKSYDLIDHLIFSKEEMVNELWK